MALLYSDMWFLQCADLFSVILTDSFWLVPVVINSIWTELESLILLACQEICICLSAITEKKIVMFSLYKNLLYLLWSLRSVVAITHYMFWVPEWGSITEKLFIFFFTNVTQFTDVNIKMLHDVYNRFYLHNDFYFTIFN